MTARSRAVAVRTKPARPATRPVLRIVTRPPDTPIDPRESDRCKVLLADIIRRSAYDWVLYRGSTRIDERKLADDAYHWLFVEADRAPNACFYLTGFLSICDTLGVNPTMLRVRIRQMQRRDVLSVSRRGNGNPCGSNRGGPPVISSITSLPESVNQQLDHCDAVSEMLGY